jgi:hypothetical protein
MKGFLQTLLHAAIGGAVAGIGAQFGPAITQLHLDPTTGAAIGSAATSVLSLLTIRK